MPFGIVGLGKDGSPKGMDNLAKERPSVAFITLGCAKNEVDSHHMRERIRAAGLPLSDEAASADVVIVNTCSFIQEATEESLEAIFDLAGMASVKTGRTKLVVAGCLPARYGEELEKELTEAHAFVPCDKEGDIVEAIYATLGVTPPLPGASGGHAGQTGIDGLVGGAEAPNPSPSAYVKLSEGCDRFCSYCTIPFIRGAYHSYPFEAIEGEVAALVSRGVKEIVLIAQDTGRWGEDLPDSPSLASLLRALATKYRRIWFRVMYLQPEGVSPELLDVMAAYDNVCPYLDIPLQHVDASILKAMNREGSRESFVALLRLIRSKLPEATLRTTVIAGFPGEREDAFESLCAFIEEAEFDYVGVFPYSQEEGTKAAGLPEQIDEETRIERAQRVRDIADAVSVAKVAGRIGKAMDVLVLGREADGRLFGRAQCQAPDVDGVVYLDAGEIGDIVRVTIGDTLFYEMEGGE